MNRLHRMTWWLVPALTASLAEAQDTVSLVVTAPAIAREVTSGQVFVGTIVPSQRAVVGSAVDGRVIDRVCEDGDRVEEGAPLAQLLTETVELELEAAEAELAYRREMLAELENGTRPLEIDQARAQLALAEARRKYLAAKLRRTEVAFESRGAASEDELESVVSASVEAEQLFQQAQAQLQLAVEGPRQERIAQARAVVAVQEAIVRRLRDQITKHTIRARFTGYVIAEFTERGAWVQQGDPVAEVAALDEVEVVVQVVEQHVPFIQVGADVLVEIPALRRPSWSGRVAAVVPQADIKARTFPVKIRVVNEIGKSGPMLKSGMSARVVLPTGSRQQATLVHKDALVLGEDIPMVYVVSEPRPGEPLTASPQPVTLGVAEGGWIQVKGEITPGQQVVVQGNERLRPGQQVKILRTLTEVPDSSNSGGSRADPS